MMKPEDKLILVVDDEADVRTYLTMVLEDAGFRVVSASDGNEALACIQKQKPDFISLDLVMPNKSGIRFYRELRKNRGWSDIPVVVVTAHARDELGKSDFEEILQGKTFSGPKVYLEKPVKAADFVRMVKRELGFPIEEQPEVSTQKIREELDSLLDNTGREDLESLLLELKRKKENK